MVVNIKTKVSNSIRTNKCQLFLIALILFNTIFQIIWIKLNTAPPMMWDDAGYLIHSLNNYYALIDKGIMEFTRVFTKIIIFHPPLITILPLPFYFLFGKSTFSSLLVYTFFIIIFCIYLFLLTRKIFNKRVALLAVAITSLFPLTYGLWRQFMIEFGLATLLVIYIFYLVKTDEFIKVKYIIPLGFICGLGLLMKETFLLFIIGPTVYYLVQAISHLKKERSWTFIRNIILLLFISFLIAGPWYFKNFQKIVRFCFEHAFGKLGEPWSLGPILSCRTVIDYWINIINFGVSGYFFGLLAILAILVIFLQRKVFSRNQLWFLGSWFLVPFSVFSIVNFKEIRHVLPIFPVVGIVIGALLDILLGQKRKLQIALCPVIFLFPVFNFFYFSFDLPFVLRKDIEYGPFVLLVKDPRKLSQAQSPLYSFPANREKWQLDQIIQVILDNSNDIGRAHILVCVEHPYLNGCTLEYQTFLVRDNLSINDLVMLGGPEEIKKGIYSSDFLVTKTKYQGPAFVNSWNLWLQKRLDKKEFPFDEIARVTLPDGSEALIYKKALKNWSKTESL